MGAIGGMVGLSGGASGTGFAGPATANIQNPVSQAQIDTAYGGTQSSIEVQQKLLQALQAQNGIQNQSQVYNQLQGIAAGTGPNPAQAMLAQSTGANVANQAALMAGQRGASQNAGLIARQAAQQGGNLQQQAAGQAATLQANQSLNAINGAGGIAGNQVSNQIGQTNANFNSQLAQEQALLNAQSGYNQAQVGMQGNINSSNAALAQTQMGNQKSVVGGLFNAAGSIAGLAQGGEVQRMAGGGDIFAIPQAAPAGPQSGFGKFLSSMGSSFGSNTPGEDPLKEGIGNFGKGIGKLIRGKPTESLGEPLAGGPMDATGMDMSNAPMVAAHGGVAINDYRSGGNVNAQNATQKAVKSGNSYANDKVPAVLSEGEVVLPRSVMQSKNPSEAAARFVQAVLAKKGMRK